MTTSPDSYRELVINEEYVRVTTPREKFSESVALLACFVAPTRDGLSRRGVEEPEALAALAVLCGVSTEELLSIAGL